jgi:hypothetical protein
MISSVGGNSASILKFHDLWYECSLQVSDLFGGDSMVRFHRCVELYIGVTVATSVRDEYFFKFAS